MQLTPEQLAAMTPQQIAAYVAAMGGAGAGGQKPRTADTDSSEIDIDSPQEGGAPALTEGDFDCDIIRCERYMGADTGSGSVPMFRVFFKVVAVMTQGPIRTATPKGGEDDNPPPGPVLVGEERKWGTKTTGDKNNQNNLVRIRSLIQAGMRFEPGSKLAESAVEDDGKPVKWSTLLPDVVSEQNPLGGKPIRVTISRIITKTNKKAMYIPTFGVSPRAQVRTDAKVLGF